MRVFQRSLGRRLLVLASVLAVTLVAVAAAVADGTSPTRPIAVNQTDGYGNDRLVAFTYDLNFDCVHGPFDDLDLDGKAAAVDPDEFQSPRCLVGAESKLDPEGGPALDTEPLYVIVPFFDADRDGQAASAGLAGALRGLFGVAPDAFDPTPGVPVQCPEPGPPLTRHTGEFGTCTMHPTQLDLGPVLDQLGLVSPRQVVNLPLPNHDHIVDGANFGSIWWKVVVVLVTDERVWPNVDGTRGLNSVADLRRAQASGQALRDVPTNFFLHFDSRELAHEH